MSRGEFADTLNPCGTRQLKGKVASKPKEREQRLERL
uniref:Uncharacterized protein n=1 Tax=Rhizophora mucronata TaxID=61149 RepID=A0A2P2JVK2_RHIMU